MKYTGLKKFVSVVMAAAILALPMVANAGFSNRPTKPYDPKAPGFDHVTFNSYTGTPYMGDERNFFTGQSTTGTTKTGWSDPMTVNANGEYYMRVYIHNGADPSMNTNAGKTGIATGTTVKVALPATTNKQAVATIHADNASPKDITDTLDIKSTGDLNLNYVPGSAVLYSHGSPGGTKLSDAIVSGGVTVGSEKLDGKWLACFDYAGFVFIKVKTSAPAQPKPTLTIAKTVAKGDATANTTTATVAPGDKVSYGITVTNNSKADATNVVVRDAMPAGVTVTGATLALNGATAQPIANYTQLFTKDGINIGTVQAGKNAVIVVHATVNADATGKDCSITLDNTAYTSATGISETSSKATLQVSKTCETPSTPTLPDTGAEGAAAAALGLTAIGTTAQAYLRSKRGLVKAVRNINR